MLKHGILCDQNSFPNTSKPYQVLLRVFWHWYFPNSLIIHCIIHEIVSGYFDLYLLISLKGQFIKTGCMIFGYNQFSHTKSFNILIVLTILAHMINGYEICFNATNYLIYNMQSFIYWLCTSILDCFGQLISPL